MQKLKYIDGGNRYNNINDINKTVLEGKINRL